MGRKPKEANLNQKWKKEENENENGRRLQKNYIEAFYGASR